MTQAMYAYVNKWIKKIKKTQKTNKQKKTAFTSALSPCIRQANWMSLGMTETLGVDSTQLSIFKQPHQGMLH
jgi:hypothetical protein